MSSDRGENAHYKNKKHYKNWRTLEKWNDFLPKVKAFWKSWGPTVILPSVLSEPGRSLKQCVIEQICGWKDAGTFKMVSKTSSVLHPLVSTTWEEVWDVIHFRNMESVITSGQTAQVYQLCSSRSNDSRLGFGLCFREISSRDGDRRANYPHNLLPLQSGV